MIAGLVLAMLSGLPVLAQDGSDTAQAVVAQIEKSILTGDKAKSLEEKLDAYRAARGRFVYLDQINGDTDSKDTAAATQAIDSLAQDGITGDVLTTNVLSTIIALIQEGKADADTMTQYSVDIDAMLSAIKSPQLQASSYAKLADLDVSRDPDAALAYLGKALDVSSSITEEESKNSTLNAVAQTASRLKSANASELVDQAIGAMWPSRARGYAHYSIAKAALAGTDLAKAKDAKLVDASAAALDAGDLTAALDRALAIDPESEKVRADALNAVLDKALAAGDLGTMQQLTTAYTDDSDQQDAIAAIVANRIKADHTLDAVAIAAKLPDGPTRARVEYMLAGALKTAGFDQMADDAFARGGTVIAALTGAQKDAALGEAILGAATLGKLDDGVAFFNQLTDPTEASSSLRKLSKALADADKVDQAQLVYAKITGADDRDYALSGIAEAQASAGDLDAANKALATITAPDNQGRVLAEMARQYARKKDFDHAFATAQAIKDAGYAVKALVNIADRAIDTKSDDVVVKANQLALAAAQGAEADLRNQLLISVVESFAKAGDVDQARITADSIADPKSKAKALTLIAKALAQAGNSKDALGQLDAVPAADANDDDIAAALIAVAADPAALEEATTRVRAFPEDMLRVRTFRLIAAEQLQRLDVLNYGLGKGKSHDYTVADNDAAPPQVVNAAATKPSAVFAANNLEMYRLDGNASGLANYDFPDLTAGVADIRKELPTPTPGYVGVTLAHLSPYNEKFLEDLPGGETGMSYAAKAQGLLSAKIIVIESGVYTLGSLQQALAASGNYQMVTRDHDVVTLRAPVIVSAGATLILSGQEASTYRLSATGGAFISVAGKLYVVDTKVTSWDEETGAPRTSDPHKRDIYRPFIIGWSGSNMQVGGSVMDSLGYSAPKSFGLGFSTGPKAIQDQHDDLPAPTGRVVDNMFHNFEYGFYSYEARDVFIVGNEYKDNVVYGVDPHDRSRRLVIALNTAYGTQYKHGIIVSREVDGSWMVGNVSFDNNGSGFMLDRDSTDTLVYGNVAFKNKGDGLTLFESSCNIATANHFFDNHRAGIKVRNSWDVGMYYNSIVGNGESAIEGYTSRIEDTSEARNFTEDPYVALTTFVAGNNLISQNGSGIKVNGVSGFSLFQQDFKDQQGPLLAGEARAFEGYMLRFNASGGTTVVSGACLLPRPAYYCGFRNNGILGNDGQNLAFAPAGQPCTTPAAASANVGPATAGG
ncbi:MAG TPA: NosD domain-containing protein [Devosiaceae bacterium]